VADTLSRPPSPEAGPLESTQDGIAGGSTPDRIAGSSSPDRIAAVEAVVGNLDLGFHCGEPKELCANSADAQLFCSSGPASLPGRSHSPM